MKEKKKIINMLKRNGFERESENHYINKYFSFNLSEDEISVAFPDGYQQFAPMNYFSALGLLYFLGEPHRGELRLKL